MTISRLANTGDLMDGGLPYRMTDQPADGWGWLDERSIVGPYVKKYFRGNGREGQTLNDKYVCFIFPTHEKGFPFQNWDDSQWWLSEFIGESRNNFLQGTDQNKGQEFEVIRNGKMDVLLIGAGGAGGGSYHSNDGSSGYAGGGGGAGQYLLTNGHEFTSDVYKTYVGCGTMLYVHQYQNLPLRGRGGDSVLQKKKIFAGLRANMDYESPQFLDKNATTELIAYGGGSGGVGRQDPNNNERMMPGASGGGAPNVQGYIFRDMRAPAIEDGVTGYSGGESAYTTQGAGGGGGFAGPGVSGNRYTEPRGEGSDWQTPAETDPLNNGSRGGDGGPGVPFNFWGEEQEASAGGGGGCYSGGKGIGGTHGGGDGTCGNGSRGQDGKSWGSGGGGSGVSAGAQASYSTQGAHGLVAIRYKLEELA